MEYKYIHLTFKSGNEELNIGKGFTLDILEMDGFQCIEWDINEKGNNQYYGATIESKNQSYRMLEIVASCRNSNISNQLHHDLIRFFGIHSLGELTVDYCGVKRKIQYDVREYKEKERKLRDNLVFSVELMCANPFFTDLQESQTFVQTWTGGMRFPFKLPFRLKQRGANQVNIYNDGHVSTPVQIIFNGPALNPMIKVMQTGEFIKVNRQLAEGDTMVINTEFGNKSVTIYKNGTQMNAFNYIDLESDFFELQVGDNMILYSTEGDHIPQSVEIRYKKRYMGV